MTELRAAPGPMDRLRGAAARMVRHWPAPVLRALSLRGPVRVDGQTLEPTMQLVAALRPEHGGLFGGGPMAARARLRREVLSLVRRPTPVGSVEALTIEGLPARLYRPAGASPGCPLTLYLHGGGFVVGDLDTHDEPCRILCAESGQLVLSLAYRLAPEHPYPAGIDDAVRVFRWAVREAAGLGADPARVGLAGDSAGATIAAVGALRTRQNRIPPAAQLLIYPATDMVSTRPSHTLFGKGFLLDIDDRDRAYEAWAGERGPARDHPEISPLLAADHAGVAPALVVTAGFDILRDEGRAYVERLGASGVPVERHEEPGLPHGFINLTAVSPAADAAWRAIARRWAALVGRVSRAGRTAA